MVDEELKELLNAMRDEFLGELRKETSGLRQETSSLREEMRSEFASVRQEFGEFRKETRQEFAAVRQENAAMHAETRRYFDIALEATRHELQLVAESVLHLDKKWTVRMDETDKSVDQRFADTQPMIKFDREQRHQPTRRRTKPN
ncbi:MAG: hypothetical protein WB973_16645 [Thermoanaerobaculia bacterium]